MKNLIWLCLLVGLFFISSSGSKVSSASENLNAKCATPNFERAYKNARAVFIGEVIGVEKDGDKKIFEFKVKKFWKGIEGAKVKVITYENRRYQPPYDVGETHLVFAKDDEEGGLYDGRCSRSRDLNGLSPSLKDDLKELGEGKTCISLEKEEKN
jgi:hypothetical protein